ncbi:MAG: hypothetical protein ACI4F4_08455 [Lachnospiraceae bacterium]
MTIYINMKQIGKRKNVIDKVPFSYEKKPGTLRELIADTVTICVNDFINRKNEKERVIDRDTIDDMAGVGKIAFGIIYGEKIPDIQETIATAITGFQDGLFRVFINDEEIEELDEPVNLCEGDRVTFIRLTMLAGRMW